MLDIEGLISSLQIIDENVCVEAIKQPLLFVDASRYRVARMRERSKAEAELDEITSRLGLLYRSRAKDGKPTNDHIKALVQKSPRWKTARDRVHRAEEKEEFAKLLLEAFRSRQQALKIIADAHWYEASKATAVERDMQNDRLRSQARRLQAKRGRD